MYNLQALTDEWLVQKQHKHKPDVLSLVFNSKHVEDEIYTNYKQKLVYISCTHKDVL